MRFVLIGAICAMSACVAVVGAPSPAPSAPPVAAKTPSAVFETRLNGLRRAEGVSPVLPNAQLQRAAQAHANDMQQRNYFSHRSPEGVRSAARVSSSGYRACAMGENIAKGQKNPTAAFESWIVSPGHRRTIVGSRYTNYGFAKAGDYWVLVMAGGC